MIETEGKDMLLHKLLHSALGSDGHSVTTPYLRTAAERGGRGAPALWPPSCLSTAGGYETVLVSEKSARMCTAGNVAFHTW